MIEIIGLRPPDIRAAAEAVTLPMDDPVGGKVSEKGIGERIKLLSKLVKAGTEHAKAVRGIWVQWRITAPRYWWSEFDTYKVGVQTLSSTSTMHKLTSRDLTEDDFSFIRKDYLLTINDVRYAPDLTQNQKLIKMKGMLPESYLQTRIVQINYQSLRNMYGQRRTHRLVEWQDFCDSVEDLKYADELILIK